MISTDFHSTCELLLEVDLLRERFGPVHPIWVQLGSSGFDKKIKVKSKSVSNREPRLPTNDISKRDCRWLLSDRVWESHSDSRYRSRCVHTPCCSLLCVRVCARVNAYQNVFICNFCMMWMHESQSIGVYEDWGVWVCVCLTCRCLYKWESQLWDLIEKQWGIKETVTFNTQLESGWKKS